MDEKALEAATRAICWAVDFDPDILVPEWTREAAKDAIAAYLAAAPGEYGELVEQWEPAIENLDGHTMVANANTVRRFIDAIATLSAKLLSPAPLSQIRNPSK